MAHYNIIERVSVTFNHPSRRVGSNYQLGSGLSKPVYLAVEADKSAGISYNEVRHNLCQGS